MCRIGNSTGRGMVNSTYHGKGISWIRLGDGATTERSQVRVVQGGCSFGICKTTSKMTGGVTG